MKELIEAMSKLKAELVRLAKAMIGTVNYEAQKVVSLFRWGIMSTRVTSCGSGGEPWEVAYLNEEGEMVGYWAHGHFDPYQEYTGQPAVFKKQK